MVYLEFKAVVVFMRLDQLSIFHLSLVHLKKYYKDLHPKNSENNLNNKYKKSSIIS